MLAIALMVVMPFDSHAQSPGIPTVSGVLVNGTQGGEIPANVTVLLHQFGVDSGSVDTFEAVTDSQGAFRFGDAPPIPGSGSAAVVAIYGGTRYSQVISPSDPTESLTLTVYELTRDVGVVATTEQSIIVAGIDTATRRMAAVQLFTLENRSDTTLVPDLTAPAHHRAVQLSAFFTAARGLQPGCVHRPGGRRGDSGGEPASPSPHRSNRAGTR